MQKLEIRLCFVYLQVLNNEIKFKVRLRQPNFVFWAVIDFDPNLINVLHFFKSFSLKKISCYIKVDFKPRIYSYFFYEIVINDFLYITMNFLYHCKHVALISFKMKKVSINSRFSDALRLVKIYFKLIRVLSDYTLQL